MDELLASFAKAAHAGNIALASRKLDELVSALHDARVDGEVVDRLKDLVLDCLHHNDPYSAEHAFTRGLFHRSDALADARKRHLLACSNIRPRSR